MGLVRNRDQLAPIVSRVPDKLLSALRLPSRIHDETQRPVDRDGNLVVPEKRLSNGEATRLKMTFKAERHERKLRERGVT